MSTVTKPIEPKDLIPFGTYRHGREEYIRKMIVYKQSRRIHLGKHLSILFENRQTVLFQIQELVFSEDLTDPAEIAEYIEIYSDMLPRENELSATLFIEIDNLPILEATLRELKGIEGTLFLDVDGESIRAKFEEDHDDRDFTTSVHYLKFPLSETAKSTLLRQSAQGRSVRLLLDHPNMQLDATLSEEALQSLREDLRAVV